MAYGVAKSIGVDTDKYKMIVQAVRDRYKAAKNKIDTLSDRWDEAEKDCRAYLVESCDDAKARAKRATGRQDYVSVYVPYSYSLLMTAYTYWSSVFLARSPIFQFTGVAGESEQNVIALEALLDYQIRIGGAEPVLHTWLFDVGKYGRGIVGLNWEERKISYSQYVDVPVMVGGLPVLGKTERKLVGNQLDGYTGNRLYNVRPHDFFHDPRVTPGKFQTGEFCGVVVRGVSLNELRRCEAAGYYFNIDELADKAAFGGGHNPPGGSPDIEWPEGEIAVYGDFEGRFAWMYTLVEMHIEIIPKNWGLGPTSYPEKWVFTIADNSNLEGAYGTLIGCQPLGAVHDKFPFIVLEYEPDSYTMSGRGIMELLRPLNYTVNWLINTHFYNVRQLLNGNLIVDPSRVVMSDFHREDENPGLLVRARGSAYGLPMRDAIFQLTMQDVTQNNLKDIAGIVDMMQRVVGVNDQVMGMLDPGGRKTATEVRTSSSFGVNRLKVNAEYFSACGFAPLSRMLVANSQQYYQAKRLMRIAGDQMQGQSFVFVEPDSIAGEYDYISVDGTLPIDRYAQAALWKDMIEAGMQNPQIAQGYDWAGMFGWIAQLAGLKNIKQFKIETMPPGAMPPPGAQPLGPPGMPPPGPGGPGGPAPNGQAGPPLGQGPMSPYGPTPPKVPVGNVGQAGPAY